VAGRTHRNVVEDPDETVDLPRLRSSIVSIGGMTVAVDVHQPGWHWAEDVRPVVGTPSCGVRHLGYLIAGRVHVRMDDGTEFEVGPGEAVDIAAGHDAWVLGDTPAEMISWSGARTWIAPATSLSERVLATILFTDVVDSTGAASRMGDRAWSDVIAAFEVTIGDAVARHGGRLVKTTGDGVLATFDGAARGIRAATSVRAAAADRGLEVRSAVHTGEIEASADDVRGLAIHEASRHLALGGPGEIIVSATTRELARDAGIEFEDRGEHVLRGFEGARRIWAVRG
jgi:class 3 adenylate cyclase